MDAGSITLSCGCTLARRLPDELVKCALHRHAATATQTGRAKPSAVSPSEPEEPDDVLPGSEAWVLRLPAAEMSGLAPRVLSSPAGCPASPTAEKFNVMLGDAMKLKVLLVVEETVFVAAVAVKSCVVVASDLLASCGLELLDTAAAAVLVDDMGSMLVFVSAAGGAVTAGTVVVVAVIMVDEVVVVVEVLVALVGLVALVALVVVVVIVMVVVVVMVVALVAVVVVVVVVVAILLVAAARVVVGLFVARRAMVPGWSPHQVPPQDPWQLAFFRLHHSDVMKCWSILHQLLPKPLAVAAAPGQPQDLCQQLCDRLAPIVVGRVAAATKNNTC